MGNPDFIAPIRSKPLSDLYKPPKRNSSLADLYNFKIAQETTTKEPFDPDFFAPLRLPKPSPLVASPQGKFEINFHLVSLTYSVYLFRIIERLEISFFCQKLHLLSNRNTTFLYENHHRAHT